MMATQYRFNISFDLLQEAGISISSLEVEDVKIAEVNLFKRGVDLTEPQLTMVRNKLAQMWNTKMGLTTCRADLEIIRPGASD